MATEKIKIKLKPAWKAKRGHPQPLSGAGVHQDKRTKRHRTRSARDRKAMQDWD